MNHTSQIKYRALLLVAVMVGLSGASRLMRADTGTCSGASITLPFTDVPSSNAYFCAIAAAYFSSLTDGTSATTFNPAQNVKREEVADFASRTLDQSLRRGDRRAALGQWWTPATIPFTAKTTVGSIPQAVKGDGADLWVANTISNSVSRVRASDGKLLGTWTGVDGANAVLVARGRVFVTGFIDPGRLYIIDPTQPPGAATLVTNELGGGPADIAYDGSRLWIANYSSVTIYRFICPGSCLTTVTTGFGNLKGILYDGSHIWVTDFGDHTLKRLNSDGSIALSIPTGNYPGRLTFDGTNIWVPNFGSHSITVVRVKDAAGRPLAQPYVLATLTGNGLNVPVNAAFDGQRVLVTNHNGDCLSLWNATDLTPLGSVLTGAGSHPSGVCSDGINFWVTLSGTNQLVRF